MKSWMEYAAAAALVGLFIVLGASSARHKSATVDEFAHLAVGCYCWSTHELSLYIKTPPTGRMLLTLPAFLMGPKIPPDEGLREDGWLPWDYGTSFMYENWSRYNSFLMAARGAAIVVGALVCVLVWVWSRRLYGSAGGLTSLTACALSPTLLAHSRLVTTDVVVALAVSGFVMAAIAYVRRPTFGLAAATGLTLGLAVLCKFTAPVFGPMAALAPVGAYYYARGKGNDPPRTRVLIAQLSVIVAVSWLTVVGGYLGRRVSFHTEVTLQSKVLSRVQPVVGLIPLPDEFLAGLDQQMVDAEQQEFVDSNYLLGKYYSGTKRYYYLVAVVAKEPVEYLLVFLAAAALVPRRPWRFDEAVLLGTVAVFFAATSLFNTLQIGIRYLLVIYPLAFVLMGKVGQAVFEGDGKSKPGRRRWVYRGLLIGAGAWALVGAVWTWPDYLAYFSPVVGGPGNGYKVLLDSNLDWGQDLPGLKDWMDDNEVSDIDLAYFGHEDPLIYGIHYSVPGTGSGNRHIAISANFLMGRKYPLSYNELPIIKTSPIWREVTGYRDQKPAAVIGHSIFIFDRSAAQ